MLQCAVSDVPSIEEHILQLVVAAAVYRIGYIAAEMILFMFALDPHQTIGEVRSKQSGDPHAPVGHRRQIVDRSGIMLQHEMDFGVGQCDADEGFRSVAEFGLRSTDEFAANWCVEEEVVHFDARTDRACTGSHGAQLSSVDHQLAARVFVLGPRANLQFADFGNRSKRFAPKPECVHGEQIVRRSDFAGGVAGNCQREFVAADSMTVVGDANMVQSTLLKSDRYLSRARIDGIFH